MYCDAGIVGEQISYLLLRVRGVVVRHQVKSSIRISPSDMFEGHQKFMMPVTRFADSGALAGRNLE